MAKMRFMMVEVEGDAATINSAIQAAVAVIARSPQTAAELAPPSRPSSPENGKDFELPPPAAAEPTPIETPRRKPVFKQRQLNDAGLPKRFGRRVIIEGIEGTHTKAEAAAMIGATEHSLAQTLSPSGQARGGRCAGKRVSYSPDGAPAPAPSHETRPRGNGDSVPFNPNHIGAGAPVAQDPEPARCGGWKPATAE